MAHNDVVATDLAVCTMTRKLSILVPLPMRRGTKGAPVDGRAGPDLNIVADFDVTQLRNFHMTAVLEAIAEDHQAPRVLLA